MKIDRQKLQRMDDTYIGMDQSIQPCKTRSCRTGSNDHWSRHRATSWRPRPTTFGHQLPAGAACLPALCLRRRHLPGRHHCRHGDSAPRRATWRPWLLLARRRRRR
uniref:Uncharacterized protein n=1 Tax=Arundo donax TaxID=35708 RepID=A0A0A9C7L3_ARUDO